MRQALLWHAPPAWLHVAGPHGGPSIGSTSRSADCKLRSAPAASGLHCAHPTALPPTPHLHPQALAAAIEAGKAAGKPITNERLRDILVRPRALGVLFVPLMLLLGCWQWCYSAAGMGPAWHMGDRTGWKCVRTCSEQ